MKDKIESITNEINVYLKLENYNAKLLKEEDLFHIDRLCARSRDYFVMDHGVEPSEITSREILEDLPPGMEYEDKYVIGYFDTESRLVALVDLIKNYPIIHEWTLGLMLIDPSNRRKGLGAHIHQNLEEWISIQSGTSIRIGVLDNNKAINFWNKTGYRIINKSVLKRDSKNDKGILIMEYLINR